MDYALEAQPDGRHIRLDPARPLALTVRRGDAPSGEIVVGIKDGKPFLDNRSPAECLVNGVQRAASLLAPGDELRLGSRLFRVIAISASQHRSPQPDPGEVEVVEPGAAPASTDSDRQRQQRRISASRMAPVGAQPGSSGLLRKVSSVFSGRAERGRLEQLEGERRSALIEAGRRSLQDGGPFGVPPQAMRQFQAGQAAQLRPQDLEGLQRWREDRQKLVRMDAEIAALRAALDLGPDPDAVVLTAPTLRSTEQAHEERVYATMDQVSTQPIAGEQPATPRSRSGRLIPRKR